MENNNNKKDNVAKHCVTILCTIAVFGAGLLFLSPNWPAAIGVIALCAMGGSAVYLLTKK